MRKLTQMVLFTAALVAAPAFADMKIAVVNYQMALLESDVAKRYIADADKKFGPQLKKIQGMEADAKRLQDRMDKDRQKMQQAELERLDLELRQKVRDLRIQSKELSEAKAAADREMLQQLNPKLEKALGEVVQKGGYDIVLERSAVVDVRPQHDITRQVIERVNQLR